jgi:hypothetical protein
VTWYSPPAGHRLAGGVNRYGILLYQDERLVRPDWGGTQM